jgi:hypothetical protein
MRKWTMALCAAALVAVATSPARADVRVGMLSCEVAPGVSYIVGSNKPMRCIYQSANGRVERYAGRISRIGIDLGFTSGGTLAWSVWAATRPGPGALLGNFVGASASATVVAGVSANALVGGFNNSITLQPLSVGVQGGLDVAVAAGGIQLTAVKPGHRARKHHR